MLEKALGVLKSKLSVILKRGNGKVEGVREKERSDDVARKASEMIWGFLFPLLDIGKRHSDRHRETKRS